MDVFQVPEGVNDVFRLSDEELSVGFGNWGSVWLCAPRTNRITHPESAPPVVAAKLVHREKTPTAAARVRSLWNEMKIVRSLKDASHQSIINFHSFIITPSYALITMDYVPRLIPVEVDEYIARDWFHSLLSGVEYLHQRGIVHNDIKPANILITKARVPVLVDFGFAEKHDLTSSKAFISDLGYGTPEYLSPERARGLEHDSRKSDVWSLGVTFFEVLVGRTPFEYEEGEDFSTKEDLERYWARTLRGKWVGSWKMSRPMEKFLRRMLSPNADLRYTAPQARLDGYWSLSPPLPRKDTDSKSRATKESKSNRGRVGPPTDQNAATLVLTRKEMKDSSRLVDITPPWSPVRALKDKTNQVKSSVTAYISPHGGSLKKTSESYHSRSLSRAKIALQDSQLKRQPAVAMGTPTVPSHSTSGAPKENQACDPALAQPRPSSYRKAPTRKPLPSMPLSPSQSELRSPTATAESEPSFRLHSVVQSTAIANVDTSTENYADMSSGTLKKISASERVIEWQREKQRLRAMERLWESETPDDESEVDHERRSKIPHTDSTTAMEEAEPDLLADTSLQANAAAGHLFIQSQEPSERYGVDGLVAKLLNPSDPPVGNDILTQQRAIDSSYLDSLELGVRGLKQSLKVSIDKAMRLYKGSTLGRATKKSSVSSLDSLSSEMKTRKDHSRKESWEDDELVKQANSSLPVVRHAVRSERLAADNQIDRMTMWISNVEKVVEEARRSFAANGPVTLPALPPAPPPLSRTSSQSRRYRTSRMQRKILAADQIFSTESVDGNQSVRTETEAPCEEQARPDVSAHLSHDSGVTASGGQRRARSSSRSPEPVQKENLNAVETSPSKRKAKSRSQGDLLSRTISPISRLQEELERLPVPTPPAPLSAVVDRSLFVARPTLRKEPSVSEIAEESSSMVHSSPKKSPRLARPVRLQVPAKPTAPLSPNTQRRVEKQYNDIIVSASGVKRVGKGYQSNVSGPIVHESNIPLPKRNPFFSTNRRVMPPPVSSDDSVHTTVDELGVVTPNNGLKDSKNSATSGVRQAFMSIINTRGVPRRSSKVF